MSISNISDKAGLCSTFAFALGESSNLRVVDIINNTTAGEIIFNDLAAYSSMVAVNDVTSIPVTHAAVAGAGSGAVLQAPLFLAKASMDWQRLLLLAL